MIANHAPSAPPFDPGLQGERTALAWNRTALSLLVNGLLVLRAGWAMQQVFLSLLAGAVIVSSMVTFAYAEVRRRQMLLGGTPPVAAPSGMAMVAGLTLLASAAGCAAVCLSFLRATQ